MLIFSSSSEMTFIFLLARDPLQNRLQTLTLILRKNKRNKGKKEKKDIRTRRLRERKEKK
jgi:hypothetical protein